MIKLVALDVDGTLIGRDLKITPRTKAAIAAARARGVRFVIVTGRMYQSSIPYARELELDGLPLVSYNGGLVREFPSGETLYHEPLPLEAAHRLAAYCEEQGYYVQGYVGDELYVPELGEEAASYTAQTRVEPHLVGPLSQWLTEAPTKMLIIDDPARIPDIGREVSALLGPAAQVAASMPHYLEITSPNVSKGRALAVLAERLGVARHEVMAVGDGMNDLDMIGWAGTGVAMGHGPAALREAADYVTEAGPSDGVAEALERGGLI